MKLKNVLITVSDIERSKKYYRELFGLETVLDSGGNVVLTEGLVLQDKKIWEESLKKKAVPESNSAELYFEEKEIEKFVRRLEKEYPETVYVSRLVTCEWGQKAVRFYDPDGNLIEVKTPAR